MGLMTSFKANKAYRLQRQDHPEEAIRLYEECFAEGLNEPRYILAYAMLIIRRGEYQKAKEFLVKHQKAPGMTTEQRSSLLVDYAACCFKLGNLDKGIHTLEQQFRKAETGLIYQTLGYLYVEKYDRANRPDFSQKAEEETAANPEDGGAETASAEEAEAEPAEPALTPEEAWNAGEKQAEEFIRKSVEYDDEDPVCLDNMGQFLYRVRGDKAAAREWFDKALARKENQIDTLGFLSLYDEEEGNTASAAARLEKALEGRFSPLNYWTRDKVEQRIARLKGER